jgi:hypothetical protein
LSTIVRYKNKNKVTKKSDKEGLLKLSITVFIVTAFSESQNRHKWLHLWPPHSDGFRDIKNGCHKTQTLKLIKTSRIETAFRRHNTESQMVTVVTVKMLYLGMVKIWNWYKIFHFILNLSCNSKNLEKSVHNCPTHPYFLYFLSNCNVNLKKHCFRF